MTEIPSSDDHEAANDGLNIDPRTSRRTFLAASAVAGTGAFGVGSAVAESDDDDDGENGDDDTDSEPFALVEFDNQETEGTELVIESVTLSDGGFVAIHDGTLLDGDVIGSVVGVSEYLPAGQHTQVSVTLFDVEGAEFDDDSLSETQPLIPMPHLDTDGDEEYTFVESEGEEDGPYVEAGNAVVDVGFAVVDGEDEDSYEDDETSFAAVEFTNQTVDDETVTVDSTVLSEGGFVAFHDLTLLEGEVTGSVVGVSEYLEAGAHYEVDVELFDVEGAEFDDDSLSDGQGLIAMPHLDTDGDEEYTFVESEGEEDGPYVEAGQVVVDLGFVTLDGDEMDDEDDNTDR
ncbi:DUF7282 domain-containing protein [Haloprofundus salilacus]|uniref:DUF7282 domain-containing protein n=1 Tax=Haloprofundus salilacus TaxID=2876190 RepID=UPI001CCD5F6E|nr:hypothetical protein [Haloprofundus salilacus]